MCVAGERVGRRKQKGIRLSAEIGLGLGSNDEPSLAQMCASFHEKREFSKIREPGMLACTRREEMDMSHVA